MRISELNYYMHTDNVDRSNLTLADSNFSKVHAPGQKRERGLSVVILTLNKPQFIIPLLEQLKEVKKIFSNKGINIEILVGDTGSIHEEVLDYYTKNINEFIFIHGLQYHFSKCNNQLYFLTQYKTILFLNNDIRFDDPPSIILIEMFLYLESSKNVSVLGSYLYFETGELQHGGIDFFRNEELRAFCFHPQAGRLISKIKEKNVINVPAVTGAFLMIRAINFEMCHGFDEIYQSECQDVDLCLKNKQLGFRSGIVKWGSITHYENGTRTKNDENWSDRRTFLRKWSSFIEANYL